MPKERFELAVPDDVPLPEDEDLIFSAMAKAHAWVQIANDTRERLGITERARITYLPVRH